MSVDTDEIGPTHPLDTIHRKTDALIDRHENIKQHKRNDQGVNHRRHQHDQRTGLAQKINQTDAELTVASAGFLLDHYATILQPITKGSTTPLKFVLKLILKRANACCYCLGFVAHLQSPTVVVCAS